MGTRPRAHTNSGGVHTPFPAVCQPWALGRLGRSPTSARLGSAPDAGAGAEPVPELVMGTGRPWPGSRGADGLGSWQPGRPTVCRHAGSGEATSHGRGCPLPAGSSEQGAPHSHTLRVSVTGVRGGQDAAPCDDTPRAALGTHSLRESPFSTQVTLRARAGKLAPTS